MFLISKLLLESTNDTLINLEGLSENSVGDGRNRPKNSISNGNNTRVLAAKASESKSRAMSNIKLEVNEANGEHKHVSFVQDFGEELVGVGGDKANQESAFQNHENFSGSWVDVRWV